jgi:PPM family protein phosphatase
VTTNELRALSFGFSDVGKKRDKNEDNYLMQQSLNLFLVADGMGGHAGGQTASKVTVNTVQQIIETHQEILKPGTAYDLENLEKSPIAKLLSDALRGACREVHEQSQANANLNGMGTTATALLLHNKHAFIGHVGDSRAYLIRNDQIMQLSEDHSLVNEQLKAGLITVEQARSSRFRNIITRSVGFEDDVDVDMIALKTWPQDIFLLCTDGLTTLVADQEIHSILSENYLHEVPKLLVDLANHRGGDDNTTIVLVYIYDALSSDVTNAENIRLNNNSDRTTTLTIHHD